MPRYEATTENGTRGPVKDPVQLYLEQINETPLIDTAAERELARCIEAGVIAERKAIEYIRPLLTEHAGSAAARKAAGRLARTLADQRGEKERDSHVERLALEARELIERLQWDIRTEGPEGERTEETLRLLDAFIAPYGAEVRHAAMGAIIRRSPAMRDREGQPYSLLHPNGRFTVSAEGAPSMNGQGTTLQHLHRYLRERTGAVAKRKLEFKGWQEDPHGSRAALLNNALVIARERYGLAEKVVTSEENSEDISALLQLGKEAVPACLEAAKELCKGDAKALAKIEGWEAKMGESHAARDKLRRANLRLVVSIAKEHAGGKIPLLDLIEDGNLGLMKAVDGYDPGFGTKFSTYATYWIKQSLKRAAANSAETVRVPVYLQGLTRKWQQAYATLLAADSDPYAEISDEAVVEEMHRQQILASNAHREKKKKPLLTDEQAAKLRIKPKQIPLIKRAVAMQGMRSLADGSGDETSDAELVEDTTEHRPDVAVIQSDQIGRALEVLATLDPREQTIMNMRFNLDGNGTYTLKEIGERIGLTRERVRQIEGEILAKLGTRMAAANRSGDAEAGSHRNGQPKNRASSARPEECRNT